MLRKQYCNMTSARAILRPRVQRMLKTQLCGKRSLLAPRKGEINDERIEFGPSTSTTRDTDDEDVGRDRVRQLLLSTGNFPTPTRSWNLSSTESRSLPESERRTSPTAGSITSRASKRFPRYLDTQCATRTAELADACGNLPCVKMPGLPGRHRLPEHTPGSKTHQKNSNCGTHTRLRVECANA